MDLDTEEIDDAVLALLYPGQHDSVRSWKCFDWDAMDRSHQGGCNWTLRDVGDY